MTKEEAIEVFEMKIELEPENEDIYNMAIKALEQQDKTEKLLAVGVLRDCESCKAEQSRWIPVSERLPEYNKPVLLSLKPIGKERTIVIGERRTRKSGWFLTDIVAYDNDHEVLAWMPLPELFKED